MWHGKVILGCNIIVSVGKDKKIFHTIQIFEQRMQKKLALSLLSREKIRQSVTFSSHFFLRSSGEQALKPPKLPTYKTKNRLKPKWFKAIIVDAFDGLRARSSQRPTQVYLPAPAAHTAHPSFPKSRCHFLQNAPYATGRQGYSVPSLGRWATAQLFQ